MRLLIIAGLVVGLMVSLKVSVVSSQDCLEFDVGRCLASSEIKSGSGEELSSQDFGDLLGMFEPSISSPAAGLAHNGGDDLYSTDLAGTVYLIDLSGALISSFSYLPHTGSGVDVTTDGIHIYLTDSVGKDVDIYTLAGGYLSSFSVAAETGFPEGITFNPFTGHLYLVDADDVDGDHVFEYTTSGNLMNTFPLASTSTDGIAFDPARCTYWIYDSDGDTITHYDPAFNSLEDFPGIENAGFLEGQGVAVIGDVLYVAALGSDQIVSFDLTGADQSFADSCVDLRAQKHNDINGLGEVGVPFHWTITVANTGVLNTTFEPGELLLRDMLPDSPTFGSPTVGNLSGISGSGLISCGIENQVLTCTAGNGPVIMGENSSFEVVFEVTPTIPGLLTNPAPGGLCQVDPDGTRVESDESNNDCTDSVSVEEEPTAIELISFAVEASDGRAIVNWETATEIDNAGFNIHRALSLAGPWMQLNPSLISAEGDPVTGAHYTFTDTPGRGTFYYRLEDIDFFGLNTLHEPALVEMGAVIRVPWYRPTPPEFE